jgi:hypothetical protein
MKYLLSTLIAFLLIKPVSAGILTTNEQITALHFYEGHVGVLVRLNQMVDPDKCGRTDWYILRDDHPHYKDTYSLLLASYLANKPVQVAIDGCVQGLPSIRHIWSYK